MANKVSFLIIAQDMYSRVAEKVRQSTNGMARSLTALREKLKVANRGFDKLMEKMKKTGQKMKALGKNMSLYVTAPIVAFGTASVVQSAKMESMSVAFESMLRSADKAKAIMEDLTQFSATTPFQLEGIAKSAKQLLGFGVSQKDIIPTLQVLGDISAGANIPLTDMAGIFGKIKAKGKAMTEELLQMSDRGIPIIKMLGDKFGLTGQQVFDAASKGQISFKVIQQTLREMTGDSGIFFKQMQRQSETTAGLWSTLKDNVAILSGAIGDVIIEVFDIKGGMKGLTEWVKQLADKIRTFAKEHPKLTKYIIWAIAFAAALGPVLVAVGSFMVAIPVLVAGAKGLGMAFRFLTGPVGLLIAAFTAGWWIGQKLNKVLEKFPAISNAIGATIYGILHPVEGLNMLWETLLNLTEPLRNKLQEFPGLWETIGAVIYGILHPIETVKAGFQELLDFAGKLKDALSEFAGGAIDKVLSLFGINSFGANINTESKTISDINVGISAPPGIVKEVSANQRKRSKNVNVGINMQEALL